MSDADLADLILRLKADLDVAFTALRRIRSLDDKNVLKAKQIANEALNRISKS